MDRTGVVGVKEAILMGDIPTTNWYIYRVYTFTEPKGKYEEDDNEVLEKSAKNRR